MGSICMVAYTYYQSDPRVRREAEAMVDAGNQVDFLCLTKQGKSALEMVEGVKVYRILQKRYRGDNKVLYMLNYLSFFVLCSLQLNSLYFKKKYSLIHVNTMPDFLVFVTLIPKILGAKIILDVHDLMPELYAEKFGLSMDHWYIKILARIEGISCSFADHVLTVTHLWWKKLTMRSAGENKCSVLMNLPDGKIFRKLKVHRDEKYFGLMYHGTLVKRYGVDIAIKAIAIVKNKIPNLRLSIIGDGDELYNLLYLTERLSIEENVYFSKQFVPADTLPPIIAKSDVGVVPNRSGGFVSEVLNTKLLEYMAMGIPIIVSRTIGVEYYFDNSMVAFFEVENERDLADKILDLYNHPEEREERVRNASKFLEKSNWETEKQRYLDIVDNLVTR